jgi:putative ABC transport system permease protein
VITRAEFEMVRAELHDAAAVALSSGFPTPLSNVQWRAREVGDVTIRGITAPYQEVQDYRVERGRPLTDLDENQRRAVVVLGHEVADKLFDAIALVPLARYEMIYGHRSTTAISVKMADAANVAGGMTRAEETMRLARQLRPGQENDFSVETAEALVAFWKNLTTVLFSVIPAVVAIGVVVGGIVIMNIMLMAVTERTREIGIRKAVGARARDIERQFLAEAISLSMAGGIIGVLSGWAFATLVSVVSPLPARITWWSVALAVMLGAGVGVLFGVYPARRAARLDPIAALRAE